MPGACARRSVSTRPKPWNDDRASLFQPGRVRLLLDLLTPERVTRIADVGANPVHVPAYDNLRRLGACEVWSFEPLPEAVSTLQEACEPNEHVLPYAIGTGEADELKVCASQPLSSLYEPDAHTLDYLGRWHKAMRVVDRLPLKTHRLDDLDDIPQPDLLKIDVQGSELDVFRNGRAKLSGAVSVISEVAFVPLYRNQPLFHEQANELAQQGFDLFKFLSLKYKALGSPLMQGIQWRKHQNQLIDDDALFTRRLYDSEHWSNEALTHLAILADSVFECFDLALKCLQMLEKRTSLNADLLQRYRRSVPFQK